MRRRPDRTRKGSTKWITRERPFLKKQELDEPALQQLAAIVRGADTSRLDLTPESEGLHGTSRGVSPNFADDHEVLRHGPVDVRRAVHNTRRKSRQPQTSP